MFQGLRQGSTLYALSRKGTPQLHQWRVTAVSNPRCKYGSQPVGAYGIEQVVDISVATHEGDKTFQDAPAGGTIADYPTLDTVISDNREAMLQEVDGMIRKSTDIIDSVEYHKTVIAACAEMLAVLNPSLAKERERDDEIARLKSQLSSQSETLARIESFVKSLGTSAPPINHNKRNGNDN